MARAVIKAGRGISSKRKSNKIVVILIAVNLVCSAAILLKLYGVI